MLVWKTLLILLILPVFGVAEGVTELSLITGVGEPVTLSLVRNRATVVVFLSLDCPMSMDYGLRLSHMEKRYKAKGVQVILIHSNRNEASEEVEKARKSFEITGPIYRDPGADAADHLGALVTPTAVVIDATGAIRYRGAVDDSRDPSRVSVHFVDRAIESVLAGRAVEVTHTRVLGCSIKR